MLNSFRRRYVFILYIKVDILIFVFLKLIKNYYSFWLYLYFCIDLFGDRCCYSGTITSSRTIVSLNICCLISFLRRSLHASSESRRKKSTKWFLISHRSYLAVCVCVPKCRSIYGNSRRTFLIVERRRRIIISMIILTRFYRDCVYLVVFHLLINIHH